MGLHLNYELRLPGSTAGDEVTRMLRDLRTRALELPFERVSDIYEAPAAVGGEASDGSESLRFHASIIARPCDNETPPRMGDVATARGFFVHPGTRCETAAYGFLRRSDEDGAHGEWFWHCSCKTQYASIVSHDHLVRCHVGLVRLLDYARSLGVDVVVRDETHYWETRDEGRLVSEVHRMNCIVAGIAGKLSDAAGSQEHGVEAPIFGHPRFERLEMGEEAE